MFHVPCPHNFTMAKFHSKILIHSCFSMVKGCSVFEIPISFPFGFWDTESESIRFLKPRSVFETPNGVRNILFSIVVNLSYYPKVGPFMPFFSYFMPFLRIPCLLWSKIMRENGTGGKITFLHGIKKTRTFLHAK